MSKKNVKTSSAGLSGIHDLNTLSSRGMRSIPPSSKSAFLDLFMNQNAKERLFKEKEVLQRKTQQIGSKLALINKRMAQLLKITTEEKEKGSEEGGQSKRRRILGY